MRRLTLLLIMATVALSCQTTTAVTDTGANLSATPTSPPEPTATDDIATAAATPTSPPEPAATADTGSHTASTPEPSAATDPTPTEASLPALMTIGEDDWFPWLFPVPTLSWYEEGCPRPTDVAIDFLANTRSLTDVRLVPLQETERLVQFEVFAQRTGAPELPVTVLTLERIDPGIVDCEAWGVTRALAYDVQLHGPEPVELATSGPAPITGVGRGHDELITIEIQDDIFRTVGSTTIEAGWSPIAWSTSLQLDEEPIDPNLVVIAIPEIQYELPEFVDPATRPFTAVKGRRVESARPIERVTDSAAALAVIGAAPGDAVPVLATPGRGETEFGSFDPFAMGIARYPDTIEVDGRRWVLIGNPQSRDFDGWVDGRFVTQIIGETDQPDEFWTVVERTRAALASDAPHRALADLVDPRHGLVVSHDGFFSEREPTFAPGGLREPTDDIIDWGSQSGTGDPIEATVAEFFDRPAHPTEAVSVNLRVRFGNTIHNAPEVFPDATIVELFSDGENPAFDWSTVRLVFETDEAGTWWLRAIAWDGWTI